MSETSESELWDDSERKMAAMRKQCIRETVALLIFVAIVLGVGLYSIWFR